MTMATSRFSMGAYRSKPKKAVRFASSVDVISISSQEYGPDFVDNQEDEDENLLDMGSSRRLLPGINIMASAGVNARPPSPPPRQRDTRLLDLTGQITREHKFPSAHGGFADVWTGVWCKGSMRVKVAIKVLRSCSDSNDDRERLNKRLRRELRIWRGLVHENVLPLLGTCSDFGPYSSMVCPWLQNGNLNKFLENRGPDLNIIDRLRILLDVAAGLSYLHSFSIVHGDLTGSNVLIDVGGRACLSDFGLSVIHAEFQGTSYYTSSIGGAVRWAAPELYYVSDFHEDSEDDSRDLPDTLSEQSDIYSFGSVMLQTLSGRVPYYMIRRDPQVLIELSKGKHPPRPPTHFVTDEYWEFIELCWTLQPMDRPVVEEVLEYIEDEYDAQLAKIRPLRDLTGQVKRVAGEGYIPFECVHVWEGIWLTRKVSVKILRPQTNFKDGQEREVKRLRRDLRTWQELDHKNVVPLIGVVADFGPHISMVIPEMGDINLTRYLNHLGDELSPSTRFMLLYEISAGLCYLHSMSVIHGGLSGYNIFIKDGNAFITDFGLIPIMAEFQSDLFPTWCGDVVRWADPGIWLYNTSSTSITKRSDIYAFGCIMLQVLTLRIPFAEWPTPVLVSLLKQAKLFRPPHPSDSPVYNDVGFLKDNHWEFIQQCWAENPIDRPTVEEVSAHVQWFYAAPAQRSREPELGASPGRPRLLRRRSIIIEDETPARESVGRTVNQGQGRVMSARPRSIVDDNESTDDEYSAVMKSMANLRT